MRAAVAGYLTFAVVLLGGWELTARLALVDAGDLVAADPDVGVGAVDRQGDDPTFVVVDLAADQVDATGRAKGARRAHASRSAWAAASGTTGFDSVPLPSSPDAT